MLLDVRFKYYIQQWNYTKVLLSFVFSAKKIELIPRSEEKGTSIEALFFAVFSVLVLRPFPHHQSIGPWGKLQETLVTIPEKWDMSMFFPWIFHGFPIFFMEQKHDLTGTFWQSGLVEIVMIIFCNLAIFITSKTPDGVWLSITAISTAAHGMGWPGVVGKVLEQYIYIHIYI